MPSFAELGLLPELLKAVEEQGYSEPTPIQAQAIPLVMEGRDVLGGAQTGTGKTAAFALPLLHRLSRHANTSASPARHPVRVLVLTPTRELAVQVEESFRTYAKYLPVRVTVVYGGMNMDPQTQALRRGVEVLVATPGRLLDHVQQKTLNLGQVDAFVLDEADRMLDMGFIPDVKRIMSLLPKQRQNLLFSATFSAEIRTLADAFLHDPVQIQVARRNAAAELIRHCVIPVARERKRELLTHLVQSRELGQLLVFCATRLGANRLAYQLNRDGVHAAAIHGDKTQAERTAALAEFKDGKVRVLVATDVAARGLDIEGLPCVVNFDLPSSPEDYVHRIGRTGRAGATGEAISLVCPEEHERLEAIEKTIKIKIERDIVAGFGAGAGDVSTLMPSPERRDERGGRGGGDRGRGRDALAGGGGERPPRRSEPRSAPPKAPADPIFSQPYRPGDTVATEKSETVQASAKRPSQPVAALLGGMPFKKAVR